MSATPIVTADRAEIHRAITLLCDVDRDRGMRGVYELRIPGVDHGVVAGLFRDDFKLADAAAEWSGRAPGVYMTLNPVASRATNKAIRVRTAARDKEIARRRRLLVDLDPTRPDPKTSSTDEEKAAARALALQVREHLTGRGWPAPILGDSGNGYHLVYAIDLPNDNPSTWLVEWVLKVLDRRFSTSAVKVDTSVFNAGRISKLYGTMACKGPNTPDRPHRLTRIVEAPKRLAPVSTDLLHELADELKDEGKAAPAATAPPTTPTGTPFDVDRYLHEHHVAVKRHEPYDGGHRWILKVCPFNPDHGKGSDTAVLQLASGAVVFKCQHDGCAGTTWQDFREAVEDRPLDEDEAQGENTGAQGIVAITAADLQLRTFTPAPEIIRGLLCAGLFLLAGAPKLGKSWLLLLLALAKAMGGEALGVRTTPGTVLFVGLEDGLRRLRQRLAMLLADGEPWPEHLFLADGASWPWRGAQAVDELRRFHDAHPDLKLVILDTFARLRPATSGKRSPYDLDVEFAAPFQLFALERELCVLGSAHTRKQDRKYRELDGLESLSGTLGLPGTADGVLVLQRGRMVRTGELLITGRDLAERKLALSFDPACGLWTCLGDSETVAVTQERQVVLDALRDLGGPARIKEIMAITGRKYEATKYLLRKLVESGAAAMFGPGTYVVTPTTPTCTTTATTPTTPTYEGIGRGSRGNPKVGAS